MTRPRSAKQNAYLWGHVYQRIAAKTGRSVQDVHDLMTLWFVPRPTVRRLSNESGDVRTVPVAHTSTLDSAAFTQFVDDVRVFAKSCLGVETDDPGYWRFGPS